MKYFAILTKLGAVKLANAAALGTKISITHMAVGDGGGKLPEPDANQTKLVNEKRRAAINTLSVDPVNTNQIIAEQIIPENEGGWWLREIGLFDSEGSMIAVANCPETYKPQLQEGSGRTQTVRMILIVNSTESVTLKVDPSVVLATREYVDKNTIEVKAYCDNAFKAHIAASDPHAQYLLKKDLPPLPDASLTQKGITQLTDKTGSSNTLAATQKLVTDVNNNANTKLAKNQNGADIPDKNAFVKNLGLAETVDKANNAVPSSRKVNGKALTGDISLSAGDVGAFKLGLTGSVSNSDDVPWNANTGLYAVQGITYSSHIAHFNNDTGSCPAFQLKAQYDNSGLFYRSARNHYGFKEDWSELATLDNIVPVGVPLPYPHRYTPAGYLTCNGQTFDKSLYPKLAEAYPSGRVPDLRGEFIRGWDDSRGVDPGRVCLTWQAGANESHSHTLPTGRMPVNVDSSSQTWVVVENDVSSTKVSTYASGANETRPRNIAFNYIVRAA